VTMQAVENFMILLQLKKYLMIIMILKLHQYSFPHSFTAGSVLHIPTPKVCPHDEESREQISGTKMRSLIQEGKAPSEFILRPEVAKVILGHDKPFVD